MGLTIKRDNAHLAASVVLFITGYGLYELIGAPQPFYLSSAILALSCGWFAVKCIFKQSFDAKEIIATQTMLWYVLPFSYIGFFGYENYITRVPESYSIRAALLVVLVAAATFLFVRVPTATARLPAATVTLRSALALALPIAILQLVLFMQGARGYAAVVFGGSEASIVYQFVEGFSPGVAPLLALSLASMLRDARTRSRVVWILIILAALLTQVLWWATAGRRSMTIILLISAVTFFSVFYGGKLNNRRLVGISVAAVISSFCLWWMWEQYYSLRLATNATMGAVNFTVLDIESAQALVGGGRDDLKDNLVTRPFGTVVSLAVFMDTAQGYLWGRGLFSQMLLTVPSVVFPGKFEVIGSTLEYLWAEKLGVPMNDWANTLFIEGYADFGIFGFPLVVIISAVAIRAILFFTNRKFAQGALAAYVYFNMLFISLNVETTFNGFLVGIRSTATVILGYWIFSAVAKLLRAKRGV